MITIGALMKCLALMAVVVIACSTPSTPAKAPAAGSEIDLSSPGRQPGPGWPPGLVPCAKDAPAGESCATATSPGNPKTAAAAPPTNDTTIWKVSVADDPARGPADALVTMVVFSDFECPFCRKSAEVFERLLREYPADLRLVWKDLPLPMHEHAEAAAELARIVRAQKGDAGFWAAHDLLYAAQPDLGDSSLRRVATELGLAWGPTWASIRAARFGGPIRAGVSLSDRVDVQATPTTFINGRKLVGAQPYERTKALVDEELTRARAMVQRGIPRGDLYGRIVSQGAQIAPPTDTPAP